MKQLSLRLSIRRVIPMFTVLSLAIAIENAQAADWTTAGISIIRIDSGTDGNLVLVDKPFTEGCAISSLGRIDDTSPNINRIVALATAAMISSLKVQFYVNGCITGAGSMVAKITDIRVSR